MHLRFGDQSRPPSCLEKADFPAEHIQGIVLSTSSPDRIQPATATRVQHELGATNAFAFDINSVCSGSTFGICMADALIKSGEIRKHSFHSFRDVLEDPVPKRFLHLPFFWGRRRRHTFSSRKFGPGRLPFLPQDRWEQKRRCLRPCRWHHDAFREDGQSPNGIFQDARNRCIRVRH